ncbi:hypothetical protein [Rhizobium sp. NZLR11]|uniref:hypothetical protein n=1 Tax=Rhizobium sp. NZLR11 TaxID=2731098 RepID=UPI001C82B079|nr:hypothetical protein [Rhizobium sp. NZLR11]MBX5206780.1 hypothetical protein [Rhizobium sp. NZLR11]
MGEIKHFSKVDFSDPRYPADRLRGKADPGFWLMVKEREMERRTLAVNALTTVRSEVGSTAAESLTPSIAVLAEELVSRIFGTCSTATLANIQEALLEAVGAELRDAQLQNAGDSSSSDADDR